VVRAAEQAAKEDPATFGVFRIPAQTVSYLAFVTAMQTMLAAAKTGATILEKHGLGENALADFEKAAVELAALNTAVLEASASHVGATSELDQAVSNLGELIGVLDGIYRYRFADSPEKLAAWNSAKNIAAPVRGKIEPAPAPPSPPEGQPRAA